MSTTPVIEGGLPGRGRREDRNKARVRQMDREVFARHNFDYLDTLYVQDYIDYDIFPGQPPGLDGFKAAMRAYATAYPDLHTILDAAIAEGDMVVVQGYFEGTNTGPFLGIPPSGIKVVTRRCEVVRFNDEGYATERWGVGAELKTLQTMRVIPKLGEVSEQSKAGTVAARFCEECFERSNPAAIADLVDERARADSKGMLELFEYVSALSDIKSRVRDAGEVGRSTAHVTLEMSGVHTGPGLGREPTKQPATMQLTVSARVSKGKIAHLWIDVAAADGRPS